MIQADGAAARSEAMIQELREGITLAMRGLYRLIRTHVEQDEITYLMGNGNVQYMAIDAASWPMTMNCTVHTGVSAAARSHQLSNLALVQARQKAVYELFGPGNPWVGEPELITMERKMAEAVGLAGIDAFFRTPTDEEVAEWQAGREALAQREAELAESATAHEAGHGPVEG